MILPFFKRKYRSFMSTANVNGPIVEQLENWLVDQAGISVIRDAHPYSGEVRPEVNLESQVELCQSMIILLSRQGMETGWVQKQFEVGLNQQKKDGNLFRIILIRLENFLVPDFLQFPNWIDISKSGLDTNSASKIIMELYSNGPLPVDARSHDVYFIRSWGEANSNLDNIISMIAGRFGFRLIVNPAESQNGKDLLPNLISTCGGGVVMIPGSVSGKAFQRILGELETLSGLRLPYIVIMDNAVQLPVRFLENAVASLQFDENIPSSDADLSEKVRSLFFRLQEEWLVPRVAPYIFYGTNLKDEHKDRNRFVCQVIQHVTTMPCLMGEDIQQGQVQYEIINRIVNSRMMVADISKENLNTCIEAGIAIGANVPVHLISEDERHKPPFMFRDRQIWHYQNDLDLLGIVHKLVLPYRRLTI